MRHPLGRALLAGVAAFAAATVVTIATSTSLSGWEEPPRLPPLHPQKVADPAPPARLAIAAAPLSFSSGDALIDAVLTVPREGAAVGVVLVAGAGPADRFALKTLAEDIAASGIAVLTYDKRTDGYSALHRDYGLLADDATAAAKALGNATGVARVGVLGISEGGWVASLAAARDSTDLSFVVLASAPVVSPLEQAAWVVDSGLRGAPEVVRRGAATVVGQGRAIIEYLDFEPRPVLPRIDVPVLAVWGAEDATLPVNEAYRRLRSASPPVLAARVVPGAGHDIVPHRDSWLAMTTAWMTSPADAALTGREPASTQGVAVSPEIGPFGDPRAHAAASTLLAAFVSVAVWRRARPRREGGAA